MEVKSHKSFETPTQTYMYITKWNNNYVIILKKSDNNNDKRE